ncbi:hypothetical protein BHM03_00017638 [Ensete ventricosum]|nr:hypothetical protein BHM03_00017638 [Ensete ventricosum]
MEIPLLLCEHLQGLGFNMKWTGRDVDDSPSFLTKDEAEQVVHLRGIISSFKAIKSMKEPWLVATGHSPAPVCMTYFILLPVVLGHLPSSQLCTNRIFDFADINLKGMKPDPPAKKTKVLVSKEAPHKDARHVAAPKKVAPQRPPVGRGAVDKATRSCLRVRCLGRGNSKLVGPR